MPGRRSGATLPAAAGSSSAPVRHARAQRAGLRIDRRTWTLGAAALSTTGALVVGELARSWRRTPTEAAGLVGAAEDAARETVEVALTGYRSGTTRENAMLNLLGSFSLSFSVARLPTFIIRRRGRFGPIRDLWLGDRHIHRFVPGIVLAFLAGGVSVVSRNEALDPLLALPFGVGVGLTLDESAMLLELDAVSWTERGVLSLQIALGTLASLSSLALALRVLRRGEREVLDEHDDPPAATGSAWTTNDRA